VFAFLVPTVLYITIDLAIPMDDLIRPNTDTGYYQFASTDDVSPLTISLNLYINATLWWHGKRRSGCTASNLVAR
jgi:hypothetical protein